MTTSDYAPIALFVFNRPEHTKNSLNALINNPEFAHSHFFVFSDGPRNDNDIARVLAVREVVKAFEFTNLTLVERSKNIGLANSVITGVTELCNQFGRVIVLEDDLVVSHSFLSYMNRALDRYKYEDRVMQISGYMFDINWEKSEDDSDAFLMPLTTSWGWATWQRAWLKFDCEAAGYFELLKNRKFKREFDLRGAYPYFSMLKKQRKGLVDSWAIRWYLSVFMANGLVLFPRKSLVSNFGFDGSGVHCRNIKTSLSCEITNSQPVIFPDLISIDPCFPFYVRYLKKKNSFLSKFKNAMGIDW